ncbi:MAG TPA: hypothetical protein VK992_05105, partial [Candidatus Caenarcaniphilales bacterium]|nr:hypothetical protein [Candidatus Caenarcaniphilales bacterium]
MPDAAISLFGGRLDPLDSLLVRQFGGVILGLGVDDAETRRAVVVANVTAFVVVAAFAAATGVINVLGWL